MPFEAPGVLSAADRMFFEGQGKGAGQNPCLVFCGGDNRLIVLLFYDYTGQRCGRTCIRQSRARAAKTLARAALRRCAPVDCMTAGVTRF